MAHTFTYTVTTLPWHQVRLTLVSDVSTGSTTVTNGGYIESLGDVSESVDLVSGDAKLKSLSFTAVNIDNVFSTHIFTAAASSVLVTLDVSFDSGTSWENLFAGRAQLENMTYRDYDATETRNRSYEVECVSYLAALDDLPAFQGIPSGLVSPMLTDARGTLPAYSTRPDGSPIEVPAYIGSFLAYFYPVKGFFEALASVAVGALSPASVPVDTSNMEHSATNVNTGLDYGFDDWHVWGQTTAPFGFWVPNCFGGTLAGGLGSASNARDVLKWLCQGLGVVPIETYSAAAGGTYTVTLFPRGFTTPAAVTGPMPLLLARQYKTGSWATGITVTTPDLPIITSTVSAGRKAYNAKGVLTTSPQWSGGPDYYTWDSTGQGVYRSDSAGKMVQCVGCTNQLFVKTGATSVRVAHKAKISAAQSYFGTNPGYYGLQEALYDYLASSIGPVMGRREGFELAYAGIRGASIDDIRPMKQITLGSDDYIIESVSRNVMTNEMKLTVAAL